MAAGASRIDVRLGSFAAEAAGAPGHGPILEAVRTLVAKVRPDATETAAARERSVSWGFGASKSRTWYAHAIAHAAHAYLGFFQGVRLPGLLEGTGKALRHVKPLDPAAARRPAVRDLVIAAHDERRRAINLG